METNLNSFFNKFIRVSKIKDLKYKFIEKDDKLTLVLGKPKETLFLGGLYTISKFSKEEIKEKLIEELLLQMLDVALIKAKEIEFYKNKSWYKELLD